MNEKEMIEEIENYIRRKTTYCRPSELAKELYKIAIPEGSVVLTKGQYIVLPENTVVLTKEEHEKLCHLAYFGYEDVKEQVRKETLEKIKLIPIECGEECGHYYLDISVTGKELLQRVYFTSSFIDGKIRKETAKEILQELYEESISNISETVELTTFQIKQKAKQYEVEVEE